VATKYWNAFARWYCSLSEEEREEYRDQHPEPDEWREFYNILLLPEGDDRAFNACMDRHYAALEGYLVAEYNRARECEESGCAGEAIRHLSVVIRHSPLSAVIPRCPFTDARNRFERLRAAGCDRPV
jgi:hypothetical protein